MLFTAAFRTEHVLPPRRVSVLVEPYILPGDAGEAGLEQEVQQVGAIDGLHVVAEPHVSGAEVRVHVVQPVGHGVDGVDDEAHLAVLDVVVLQVLITCRASDQDQDSGFRVLSSLRGRKNNKQGVPQCCKR